MADLLIKLSKVAQWDNGAAVRFGAAVLERAHPQVDHSVELIVRDGEIVIRRPRPRVTMADLLARFDPELHRHDLQLDGKPMGNETR